MPCTRLLFLLVLLFAIACAEEQEPSIPPTPATLTAEQFLAREQLELVRAKTLFPTKVDLTKLPKQGWSVRELKQAAESGDAQAAMFLALHYSEMGAEPSFMHSESSSVLTKKYLLLAQQNGYHFAKHLLWGYDNGWNSTLLKENVALQNDFHQYILQGDFFAILWRADAEIEIDDEKVLSILKQKAADSITPQDMANLLCVLESDFQKDDDDPEKKLDQNDKFLEQMLKKGILASNPLAMYMQATRLFCNDDFSIEAFNLIKYSAQLGFLPASDMYYSDLTNREEVAREKARATMERQTNEEEEQYGRIPDETPLDKCINKTFDVDPESGVTATSANILYAAQRGDPDALRLMGANYLELHLLDRAMEYLQQAADLHCLYSLNEIAKIYEVRALMATTPQERTEMANMATRLAKKAADEGDEWEAIELYIAYCDGRSNLMPPNLNEKFINLNRIVLLADGADTSNVVMLARMYLKGQGTPVNPKAAFQLLSALEPEQHDPEGESLFLLAYLYEEGLGTPPDMPKAFELYLESSNRGYPQAWNNLGTLYETGTGTQKDIYRARECYQEAADRKDTEGKANLERLKSLSE